MPAPVNPYQPYKAQHANPAGKGDGRPTCAQILHDAGEAAKLRGKVILITGCTSGIGIETARALYTTGAQLFLTARDLPKLEKVINDIVIDDSANPRPKALEMSLDSLASIRQAADSFMKQSSKLNVLVENAGVMCAPYGLTKDGFETQFGTNHLGHFYLFHLLKPLMLDTASNQEVTRLVVVSSAGHRRGPPDLDDLLWKNREYDPLTAYCHSKTANIWMANEVDRRYASKGLRAVSLHPGMIWTEISRHLSQDQLKAMGVDSDPVKRIEKSPDQGAATTVWAAVSPYFNDQGGYYLGDCGVCSPGSTGVEALYSPHAYDEAGEKALWETSCKLVRVTDDEQL